MKSLRYRNFAGNRLRYRNSPHKLHTVKIITLQFRRCPPNRMQTAAMTRCKHPSPARRTGSLTALQIAPFTLPTISFTYLASVSPVPCSLVPRRRHPASGTTTPWLGSRWGAYARRHFAPCYLPSTLALFPQVVRSPGGVGGEGEAGFLGWRATRPIARADSTRLHIVQIYASIMDYGDGRCINGYRNLYTLVWSRVELYRLAAALIRLESPIRMRKTNGKRLEIWLFDKVKKENAKLQKLPCASTTLLLSTVSESNRYLYSEKMSIYWNRFLYHFDQTEKKANRKNINRKNVNRITCQALTIIRPGGFTVQ